MNDSPQNKRSRTSTIARHRSIGAWLFGILLLIFIIVVFFVAKEDQLQGARQRIVGFICACLAGFWAYFFTGTLGVGVKSSQSRIGELTLQATSGLGLFALVLIFWLIPITHQTDNRNANPSPSSTVTNSPQPSPSLNTHRTSPGSAIGFPSKTPENGKPKKTKNGKIAITGTIIDEVTKEKLKGADISSSSNNTTSDNKGWFELPVDVPEWTEVKLTISMPGYEIMNLKKPAGKEVEIRMKQKKKK